MILPIYRAWVIVASLLICFTMPHLVPIIAAVYVWVWLLNGSYGLVNELLFQFGYWLTGHGIVGPNYFGDPTWALWALMLIALWGAIGGNMMVIFLAGLQGIPQELYEAASMDGPARCADSGT